MIRELKCVEEQSKNMLRMKIQNVDKYKVNNKRRRRYFKKERKKVRKEKLMTTDGENKSSRMKRPLGAMRSGLTRNFL